MALPASPPRATVAPSGRWWVHRSAWVAGWTLLAVAAIAWVGVVRDAASMADMDAGMADMDAGMGGMGTALGLRDGATYVGSWGVMMAAMMLPSAVPMIALYSTVNPGMAARRGARAVPTAIFAALYVLVWLSAGVLVYAGAVIVSAATEASAELTRAVPYAVAAVLVGAGLYQFSAAKRACLRQCRGPLAFLAERWHPGIGGAVRVGLEHAGYCLGCCGALMIVLVAAGAMGLAWVLLIAALVLAEKILPYGERTATVTGAALVVLGLAIAISPDLATSLRF
jgi:predicted metal-binding membrane protein